jgi:hypothetical protein
MSVTIYSVSGNPTDMHFGTVVWEKDDLLDLHRRDSGHHYVVTIC